MALASGTRLGPYEVVAPLGAGGMGEVYRALDPRLRRDVAIKILPAGLATDPAGLRRFEQEALAAASLNHPNILAVYDIGMHEGAPYIVSELLEGETLRQMLEGGALPVRRAIEYAVQIAQGLAAAHAKGIVHRDLKPENLFVTRTGSVKILDFGLAKLAEPALQDHAAATTMAAGVVLTQPGVLLGTPEYMSPEQVRGEAADERSDIFSYAVVLFEVLTGRRPFTRSSVVETMNAILKEDPPDLASTAGMPPIVLRIILRCLEKRADDRFQSARDLAFGLQAVSSVSESGIAASETATRGGRRRWLAPATGIGLLVAAAAGAWIVSGMFRPASPTFARLTFRRGTVGSAKFAPDGQTIVYSAAWQGKPSELFSTRVGSAEARALGSADAVFGISSAGEMAIRNANGRLARASLAGGEPREVIEYVASAAWSRDGQTLAIVRPEGGRRRLEFPQGNLLYETTGQIASIAIAPNGKSVAFAESRPGIGPVWSISLVDLNRMHTVLSADWRTVRGVAWSPNGREVWFSASKVLYGAGTVFAVTPTRKLREVIHVPGNLDLFDVFADGRALIGRSDRRLEVLGLVPGETRERDLSWLDYNGLSDLSADGRTLIITEDGEAGLHVYQRKTDGSPAIRIADGGATELSVDGRSVILSTVNPLRVGVMPVGPGEPRFLPMSGFDGFQWANWFPGEKRILFAASEAGHRLRLYVGDIEAGSVRPFGPEGTTIATGSKAISPDGTLVATVNPGGAVALSPVDGGTPRPAPGVARGEIPSRWSADGRFLYVYTRGEIPTHVFRVDMTTGAREPWKELGPPDTAGVTGVGHVLLTPDGRWYAYNYPRTLTDLFVVDGLR